MNSDYNKMSDAGWHRIDNSDVWMGANGELYRGVPIYTASIETAWELIADVPFVQIDNGYRVDDSGERIGGWTCAFVDRDWVRATAATAPRAICVTWLKSTESKP
jgi:hypothetical protein